MFDPILFFIRQQFNNPHGFVPLHEPKFAGNEVKYVTNAIESTFVSSVGAYVDKFEVIMQARTQTKRAVAVVNGTAGIQVALRLVGVNSGDEVITQALTFVATANAITHAGATPIFVDVDKDTMGLSAAATEEFLCENAELREDGCYNKFTHRRISACLPMHTFGFPVHLEELLNVCNKWRIPIVEDAAESLGSEYRGKPTGGFGSVGVFSLNGNKIVTSGGGGVIVTNEEQLGIRAKHLITTAKIPHPYEYVHDELGYNFRMPNLNAALACAQLEQLSDFLDRKRILANEYKAFFDTCGIKFCVEQPGTKANYWLMAIELDNKADRDLFLKDSNQSKVMTRPIWQLLFKSPMYSKCQRDQQVNASFLEERIVNIPSSVR